MSTDTPHYYKSAWRISPSTPDDLKKAYIPSYMRERFDEAKVIKLPQNIFSTQETAKEQIEKE